MSSSQGVTAMKAKINNLTDVFTEALRDIYNAEISC